MKKSLITSTALCMIISTAPAHAQNSTVRASTTNRAADTTQIPVSSADTAYIGEIVVTAQKRSESIQKVPITIAAVTGAQLQEQKIISVVDLATITSGLNFSTASTGIAPFIRGFGNHTGTVGNEPPVAIYVDGVYLPSSAGSVFTLNNIDRIEVLKGPQGTLFGRNAAAGAINIITRTPSHTPSMDLSLGFASYNTVSSSFYGTTGLTQNVAIDLAVSGFNQTKGWGRNLYNGSQAYLNNDINVRSKFLWSPGNNTIVTVEADYDKARSDPGVVLSGIPGSQNAPYTNFPLGGFYDTNDVVRQYRTATQWGGSLQIEQDFPWAKLTSITSGRTLKTLGTSNITGLPVPFQAFEFNVQERTYTEELNLQSSPALPIKWIIGLFYFNDRAGYSPFSTVGTVNNQGPNGANVYYGTQVTNSYSGYAQATAPLTPISRNAHLTLGVRYTDDEHRLTRSSAYTLTSAGILVPSAPRENPNPVSSQGAFTYQATLDYSPTPSTMVYASYNRGFKSGSYTISSLSGGAAPPTLPEFIDAYEIGFKSRFFDKRLLLNIAGFYYGVKNLQVKYNLPGAGVSILGNAAAARNKGVDANIMADLTSRLQFIANVTYTDFEYSSYPNAPFVNFVNGVNVGSSHVGDATGNAVVLEERWSGNVGARYHARTSAGSIVANANLSFHSKTYFDVQNAISRDPYYLVNANIGWTSLNGSWGVDLWGRNLNGAKYVTQINYTTFAGTYSPGAPLTVGATIRYHLSR